MNDFVITSERINEIFLKNDWVKGIMKDVSCGEYWSCSRDINRLIKFSCILCCVIIRVFYYMNRPI